MSDHLTFKNRLLGLQSNLLNFAYQLTTNRDAAQDLSLIHISEPTRR